VQQNDRSAIGLPGFGVADVQHTGVDLPDGGKRRVRTRFDRGQSRGFHFAGLCCRGADHAKLRGGNRRGRSAKKEAAMLVDVIRDRVHR